MSSDRGPVFVFFCRPISPPGVNSIDPNKILPVPWEHIHGHDPPRGLGPEPPLWNRHVGMCALGGAILWKQAGFPSFEELFCPEVPQADE